MQNDEPLVTALRRAATELPASQLHKLADVIAKHEELSALARHEIVNAVPTAVFRDHAAAIYEAWATIGGQRVGATGVALAVHTAADAVQDVRGEVQVSVVWTGPASYEVPIRATSAVLGEVIDEAQKVLIVVSFAAYKVSAIVDALRAAAGRGVDVRLVLESVVESKGNPVSTVADQDQLWRKFLYALYDATAESPSTSMLDFRVLAESIGIENTDEQANVAQWLVAHHLAEWRAVGGQIGISSAGVDALEDKGREITFLSVLEIRQVEVLLTEIRRACELNEVTVHDEDRAVFDTEIATINAQIKSPSPKRKVVGVALRSLGGLLSHAGAGVLGGSVRQLAQHLMR